MKRLMLTILIVVTGFTQVPEGRSANQKPVRRAINLDVPRDRVIAAALYTVHANTLKLSAQLFPLKPDEPRIVRLEIKKSGTWKEIARVKICENEYGNASGDKSWTALFRIEKWDDTKAIPYRVRHGKNATFEGLIRKNPIEKKEIVVAAFTGNSINPRHGGDISRKDLVENIKRADADLLFFSGDQVYNHTKHYEYWVKFCLDFAEVLKDRPTVSIPDDHDVGQPNLWGQNGKVSTKRGAVDGGYAMPAKYVKEVERAQTAHLPDPFDHTPIQQGIGTYFTHLTWGRVSFAILEDRKFKTGPMAVRAPKKGRADHVPNADFDVKTLDKPGLKLLGDRQLKFLNAWGQDWKGADFKVALSQTIFCGGAHIHGKVGGRLYGDLDSNGWPQKGRTRAIKLLRKAYALHLAGDQHLATVFHHGVDDFRDSIYSFCVPSIANLYLRWWEPLKPGGNRKPGQGPIYGDHFDTFGNRVTCIAVANPDKRPAKGDKLTTRAAGFGLVRFNKTTRKITIECWPRNVNISAPGQKPYPGWPVTIDQTDNYGRQAVAHLPTIRVNGSKNPVIKVIDESTGEWVYALRINGSSFQPKVFKKGTYTVEVNGKRLKGLKAEKLNDPKIINVSMAYQRFLGNWAMAMPNGNAGWLSLSAPDGKLKGQLWTVGSPKRLVQVSLDGRGLQFQRMCRVGKPEFAGGPPTGKRVACRHTATVNGNAIQIVMHRPTPNGRMEKLTFKGKRIPPIPGRPDLSSVKFGKPIALFNGRNLEGWKLTNPKQINGWKAIDGVLVNTTPKLDFKPYSRYGNLQTVRKFMDFNLKIEFKVPPGGNSGIYLRGVYEAQVVDRDSRMQGIQGVGAIFGRIAPGENAGKPGGEWQQYDITLVDRHVTVILNGKKVIDNQPIAGCTNGALQADETIPGPLYLQGDHTAVSYRNIVLRPVLKD